MNDAASRALAIAALALLASVACTMALLPPLAPPAAASLARPLALGGALAASLVVHAVFIGLAAERSGRPLAGWVGLSLLLYPIGSVAAVVLLGWPQGRPQRRAAA